MGLSSPLPVSLPNECRRAAKLYSAFADPVSGLDKIIPVKVLRKAKGFAFLTVVKAGFVFSARAGTGVVIARLPDGSWSAPSACGTAGGGFGLQAGVEMAEFIIILNSRKAVQSFMAAGSITLGGNLSIAAGPLGRNIEGTGAISSKGKVAAMYSYSRTKGLFGGASIEGSVIVERSDANCKAYGHSVTSKQLLSGAVEVPEFAEQLIETISRRSGNASNWQPDEEDTKPSEGGYEFESQYASGGRGNDGGGMQKSGSMSAVKSALGSLGGRSRSGSGGSRSRSGSTSGPTPSASTRFDQDFGDDYESEQRRKAAAIEEEDSKWGTGVGGTAKSTKLTKPRSGSGGIGGIRGMADGMNWDANSSSRRGSLGTKSRARESFDSLDERSSAYREAPKARYDASEDDDDSFDDRRRRTTPQRFPKQSTSESPFADSNSTSRQASLSSKGWETDDFAPSYASTTPQRVISSPLINKGDPFDFSEVEADFSGATSRQRDPPAPAPVQRARAATVGKGIGQAVALFDFTGAETGDLSFKKGDVITILKQDDEEWWNGRVKLVEGIFPRNYVEVL